MHDFIKHVVIGGGPAGSMLAFRLAAAGSEVVLLEKQRKDHHKVCGEFLSAEALGYLQSIGIDLEALGAQTIQRVRLHSSRRSVQTTLPFPAFCISRRVLDEALLEKAQSAGCEIRRNTFVERLSRDSGGFSIHLRGNQVLRTNNVFLATGKHDLAEHVRANVGHPDLVGFKMHWHLTPQSTEAIRHIMELFIFRGGYGGLALIENDIANLCFVIHQRRMRSLGGWPELLDSIREECPAVDRIMQNATPCWPRPLAISPIPYGYIAKTSDGIWRIGDQAAVIPSFTGDGMSIALHSAQLASEMFLAGKFPDDYLARLHSDLHSGMRFATSLSRMMISATGRLLAPTALFLMPGAISWIAGQTRIPPRALKRTDQTRSISGGHFPVSAA